MENLNSKAELLQRIKAAPTLAAKYRAFQVFQMEQLVSKSTITPKQADFIFKTLIRFLEPWPDWAIRIFVEVLSVRLPSIEKSELESYLKLIHWFLYEVQIEGESPPKPSVDFEGQHKENFAKVVGNIMGVFSSLPNKITQPQPLPQFPASLFPCARRRKFWAYLTSPFTGF